MIKLLPKNWGDFQHYKHRSPPWVRLHKSLLDDCDFQCLPVASRALAPMLWLLASESKSTEDGAIEYDLRKLAFRLRQSVQEIQEAIKPLIDGGFFALSEDASNALADHKQVATTETEKSRVETENKNPMSGSPPANADVAPSKAEKKPKSQKPDAVALLDLLNERTGRHYRPTDTTLKPILARLKEGYTIAECKGVIVRKWRQWGADDKMREYLRPETLFGATKFAQYVGEVPPPDPEPSTDGDESLPVMGLEMKGGEHATCH